MLNGRGYEQLTLKHNESSSNDELTYAMSSMQGWRNEQEDAHCAYLDTNSSKWSFFAVFDGHGGTRCSQEASKRLFDEIMFQLIVKREQTGLQSVDELNNNDIIASIKAGFFSLDNKLREMDAFKSEEERSGSTVVAALLTQSHIYLINCGDSRALLIRDDFIELSTYDHKPTQLKERQRIQNAGGIVALSRVNGGLATSRGLGDFEYKSVEHFKQHEQFVSCEPDIFVAKREPARDRFIILACDGIWDVMRNEDVLDYINKQQTSQKFVHRDFLTQMSNSLLDLCFEKGSKDNMTLISVYFNRYGEREEQRRVSNASQRPPSRLSSARKRVD